MKASQSHRDDMKGTSHTKESNLSDVRLIGLEGIPEVRPGDSLADQIVAAAEFTQAQLSAGDVLVVAQKIISKAEGRLVRLQDVEVSDFARTVAQRTGSDERLVEMILRESRRVLRMEPHALITETHHGFVCANAGIDHSNIADDGFVSLLPLDPDVSARSLRDDLGKLLGFRVGVIVSDTFGRPWRQGLTNVAIGVAGINPLSDFRRTHDDHGRLLYATIFATADELAAAAGLIMRKTRRLPAVLIKGFEAEPGESSAQELLRPKEQDLFRF